MMRTRMWPLLLFSFVLIGCRAGQMSMAELAQIGAYEELLDSAKTDFTKEYKTSSLYYIALSQARTGKAEHAYHSLMLYDQITEKSLQSVASYRLMVELASQRGDFKTVVDRASWLEQNENLDENAAFYYYQALLHLGREAEATEIFSNYLKHTIDQDSWARMLVINQAEVEQIGQALAQLDDLATELSYLHLASQQNNAHQRAMLLFELARTYENTIVYDSQLKLLYEVLAALAVQSDQRVQANKYRTLALGQ